MLWGLLPAILSTILYAAIANNNLQLENIDKRLVVIQCVIEIGRMVAGDPDYKRCLRSIASCLIKLTFIVSTYFNPVEKLHLYTCINLTIPSIIRLFTWQPHSAYLNTITSVQVSRLFCALFFALLSTLYILPAHLLHWLHCDCSTETHTITFSCLSLVLSIISLKSIRDQIGIVRPFVGRITHLIYCVLIVSSSISSTDKLALITFSEIVRGYCPSI